MAVAMITAIISIIMSLLVAYLSPKPIVFNAPPDSSRPILAAWMKEREESEKTTASLRAQVKELEHQLNQSKELIESYDSKLSELSEAGKSEEECRDLLRDQYVCDCSFIDPE